MDQITKAIRDFYDGSVEGEWNRIAGRPEFLLPAAFWIAMYPPVTRCWTSAGDREGIPCTLPKRAAL